MRGGGGGAVENAGNEGYKTAVLVVGEFEFWSCVVRKNSCVVGKKSCVVRKRQ